MYYSPCSLRIPTEKAAPVLCGNRKKSRKLACLHPPPCHCKTPRPDPTALAPSSTVAPHHTTGSAPSASPSQRRPPPSLLLGRHKRQRLRGVHTTGQGAGAGGQRGLAGWCTRVWGGGRAAPDRDRAGAGGEGGTSTPTARMRWVLIPLALALHLSHPPSARSPGSPACLRPPPRTVPPPPWHPTHPACITTSILLPRGLPPSRPAPARPSSWLPPSPPWTM